MSRALAGVPRSRPGSLADLDALGDDVHAELIGGVLADQATLVDEYATGPMPSDDSVDAEELISILREAVQTRNGWKRILARCAPSKERRP